MKLEISRSKKTVRIRNSQYGWMARWQDVLRIWRTPTIHNPHRNKYILLTSNKVFMKQIRKKLRLARPGIFTTLQQFQGT